MVLRREQEPNEDDDAFIIIAAQNVLTIVAADMGHLRIYDPGSNIVTASEPPRNGESRLPLLATMPTHGTRVATSCIALVIARSSNSSCISYLWTALIQ